MSNIGFIGYGSMGSMYVKGLINNASVKPGNIFITRRNKDKLKEIKEIWSEINITDQISEVIHNSQLIFICVEPVQFYDVLKEIQPVIKPDQHIISIAGALTIIDIESIVQCKITKLLPTVITEVKEGITLVCHNELVKSEDVDYIKNLLGNFVHLRETREEQFGLATIFTSCGPGLYSAMLHEFAKAGARYSDSLTMEEISQMILKSVYGTTKLMLEQNKDFNEVIQRVSTKGGLTEEGVKILQEELPGVYDDVVSRILVKRDGMCDRIHGQFTDN